MEPMKMVTCFLYFFFIFFGNHDTTERMKSDPINLWVFVFFCAPDLDSDSECSQHSCQSVRSEKTLLEKLEILKNQGLIQVVKICVDWLRANTDIILMCAQVRGQVAFSS